MRTKFRMLGAPAIQHPGRVLISEEIKLEGKQDKVAGKWECSELEVADQQTYRLKSRLSAAPIVPSLIFVFARLHLVIVS